MDMHSLGPKVAHLLAYVISKLVKHGIYSVKNSAGETVLTVQTRLPYEIQSITTDNGIILVKVGKEDVS